MSKRFVLHLIDEWHDDASAYRRMRMSLKVLLRRFGLRNVESVEVRQQGDDAREPASPSPRDAEARGGEGA